MSEFEVVRSEIDGWDVRRVGEAQALSNHATREEAEEAARLENGGRPVEVHADVYSEPPVEEINKARMVLTVAAVALTMILLIAVIGYVVSVTGFGN